MDNSLIGTRLGKYEIQAEVGRGGMGAVYRGYDPVLDRYVAVKVLAPHLLWEQQFVERFLREARAAARLKHAGIVTIYDVGHEGSWYYIVMEYLEGRTLTDVIRQRGPMAPAELLRILRPLAEALDYAHHQGLVHRDIKPGNIIVGSAGQVTLTDFGIARAAQETRLTATGAIVGTPEYMSPEQAKGLTVDARSDQYSLAVAAYEMLSGRVPFKAESTLALLHKIVYDPPPPVRQVRPDLPATVESVLGKALAKEPGDRYATLAAFVDALGRALAGEAVEAPSVPGRAAPPAEAPTVAEMPAAVAAPAPRPPPATPLPPIRSTGPVQATHTAPARAAVAAPVPGPAPARRRVPVWVWALGGLAVLALVVVGLVALIMLARGGGERATRATPTARAALVASEATSTLRPTSTPMPAATPTARATPTPTPTPVLAPTRTPRPIVTPVPAAADFPAVPTAVAATEGLNGVYYYNFNATLPPFDDPLVRRAFVLAVDREALVQIANEVNPDVLYVPATSFTAPDALGLDLYGQVGLPYDPELAIELLAQAGYPGGSGLPQVTLWHNEVASGFHRSIAEAVRDQWREVLGVKVILQSKPSWDEYQAMLSSDTPQVWSMGWRADYVDAHNFLHDAICGGYNDAFYEDADAYGAMTQAIADASAGATRQARIAEYSELACTYWSPTRFRWSNAEFADLLQTALRESNQGRRREMYVQAERILCEVDAAVMPIFHLHYSSE